jgi:hypothetical protein
MVEERAAYSAARGARLARCLCRAPREEERQEDERSENDAPKMLV